MGDIKVGARELKAHLGRYVKVVRAGGTVVLTEWGKPVARLVPIGEAEEKPPLEERMWALVRTGRYDWAGGKPEVPQPTIRLQGDKTIEELVIEDSRAHEDDLYEAIFGESAPLADEE